METKPNKKSKVPFYIIAALVIGLILQFVFHKREVTSLELQQEKDIKKEKLTWEKERDSLNLTLVSELQDRRQEVSDKEILLEQRARQLRNVRSLNNSLNRKLKDYEKNLIYANRSLDAALDVHSKYKYKGDTKSAKENR